MTQQTNTPEGAEEKIKQFIGTPKYDSEGQYICGVWPDGGLQNIADLRGWGAIQYMFKDSKEAEKFQDQVGEWIVDAIKQKLDSSAQTAEIKRLKGIRQDTAIITKDTLLWLGFKKYELNDNIGLVVLPSETDGDKNDILFFFDTSKNKLDLLLECDDGFFSRTLIENITDLNVVKDIYIALSGKELSGPKPIKI